MRAASERRALPAEGEAALLETDAVRRVLPEAATVRPEALHNAAEQVIRCAAIDVEEPRGYGRRLEAFSVELPARLIVSLRTVDRGRIAWLS